MPVPTKMAATDELNIEIARLRRCNHALTLRLARALEQERKAIARELHDEIGQSLTAIKTDAVLVSNLSQGGANAQVHASAQAILGTVSRIYEVVYSMMRRLRPSVLDELGLSAAIEALINEWRKRHPYIPCQLDVAEDLNGLDDLIGITVYRAVQESLTNVERYSAATRVTVTVARLLTPAGEQVCVTVEDNGRGMDVKRTLISSGQYGLRGLIERVEALNGHIEINSVPGHGTRVSVWLPAELPADNDEDQR